MCGFRGCGICTKVLTGHNCLGCQGNDTDPEDSETTSGGDGGDGDQESKSAKSGETGESPSLSSAHSSNLTEGDQSPGSVKESTVPTAAAPPTSSITTTSSSQFIQICKDGEMACSRTDLVYVTPPPEGRRNRVSTEGSENGVH